MKKTFLHLMLVLSLLLGLIGCPNNPDTGNGSNNDQTEQTQEEKNKATSGLEKDLTVIGKIEDTTCDITLNAENGTFTATQSSRSDEVSYSGEFFYYNGKLQLKVTSKNEQTLSSDDIICLTAEVAETALTSDEPVTFTFETNSVTEYEAAKTEFRAANATTDNGENDTVTFEPSGKRYISSDLKKMITIDGETSEYPETKKYMDFSQNNMVLFGFLDQFGIPALEYSVNGNTITIDISYEFTTQRDSSPEPFKDTFQGNFTGIISKDGNTISNFSGEMTNMHDSIANSQRVTQKIVVSISQCTFIKNNTTNDTTTTIPSGTDTTFSLNGSRYYCESMNTSTTMTANSTSVGTAEAICDFTEDGVFTNFFPNGSSAAYTISGNTVTINVNIDYTANGTNVSGSGTLTCILSDDRKSLSLTGEVSVTSASGNVSVAQKISYSGIFDKIDDIVDLTDKTYTAVTAKIGDETVTNSQTFKLDFTDLYNVKFTQGTQSISSLESLPYFVIGDKININVGSVTIDDVMYSGAMSGTISSNYSSITIYCNLTNNQTGADNTFDWTFTQD